MDKTSSDDFRYKFDYVEYIVFTVMLGISVMIGVYFGFVKKGSNTVLEYLFGDKRMPTIPISISIFSSIISGNTLLGAPTETYLYGGQYLITFFTAIAVGLTTTFVFLPVFYKLQLFSLYEYLELRFCSKVVRVVASLLFIVNLLTYIPVVIYGPAVAVNQVSGMNVNLIIGIISLICIFYTAVGGLKAVVWSDAVQGTIMILSSVVVAFCGTIHAGGVTEVVDSAYKGGRLNMFIMDVNPTLRLSFWSSIFGFFIQLSADSIYPSVVQRLISLPTERQAKLSFFWTFTGCAIFSGLCGLIGIIMYAFYKNCDPYLIQAVEKPDQLLPYFILDMARKANIKGLPGLFLSGTVCAGLSTMSTGLNTVAVIIYNDFIEPFILNELTEKRINRIMEVIVVVFGGVCILLVLFIEKLGTIMEISIAFGGITSGATIGIFILGVLFPMSNAMGAITGGLVGLGASTWIMIGSTNALRKGLMKYPTLPISAENCTFNATNFVRTLPQEDTLFISKQTTLGYNRLKDEMRLIKLVDEEADTVFDMGPSGKRNDFGVTVPLTQDSDVFVLYKISPFYYSLIGCCTVIIVGLIVSCLTGPNKAKDIDRNLLCPLIYRFLPKLEDGQYSEVPQADISQHDYEI